jgi:hypothetical protein
MNFQEIENTPFNENRGNQFVRFISEHYIVIDNQMPTK